MKSIVWISLFLFSLPVCGQTTKKAKAKTYVLIHAGKETTGKINQIAINKLDEPLRAVAAYYSGLGGTNCRQDTNLITTCDLTTALGLGSQGSEQHKALIKKWFPGDKAARQLIAQNCYQRPSGASSFSEYVSLSFSRKGNVITIRYSLMTYNQGEINYIKGPDRISIVGNTLKVLKRSIWKRI